MSIKGKYLIHKESLSDKIFTCIKQFEDTTGCNVLSIKIVAIKQIHLSCMDHIEEKDMKLASLEIKTDIEENF